VHAPVVAILTHVLEHALEVGEALLGKLCAVLRLYQCGRCAVARSVAVRTVALRRRVDAVQLGGLDPLLPERILCGRQTARLDRSEDGGLVDAACRCGVAEAVAHGVAPRRVVVPGQGCGGLVKEGLTVNLATFATVRGLGQCPLYPESGH
jgi:hypothetical protein